MDWIECNICGIKPHQGKIFLTSCGHLFCVNCLKRANDACLVCKKAFRAEEVNKNMPPDLLDLFRDPREYSSILLKELQSVITWQEKQKAIANSIRQKSTTAETETANRLHVEECRAQEKIELSKKRYTEAYDRLKSAKMKKNELIRKLEELREQKSEAEKRAVKQKNRLQIGHLMRPTRTEPAPSKNAFFRVPSKRAGDGFFDQTFAACSSSSSSKSPDIAKLFESSSSSGGEPHSRFLTSTPVANIEESRKDHMMRMFGMGLANPSPIMRQ